MLSRAGYRMKLSDAFVRVASAKKETGHNEDILSKCPALKEYMEFIEEIRKRKEVSIIHTKKPYVSLASEFDSTYTKASV